MWQCDSFSDDEQEQMREAEQIQEPSHRANLPPMAKRKAGAEALKKCGDAFYKEYRPKAEVRLHNLKITRSKELFSTI